MPGLLGVARGRTAPARLHDDRRRRPADRHVRNAPISAAMINVAIVGAGPAGIAPASALAGHGVMPVMIDEGHRPGGQTYRQARPGLQLDIETLLGTDTDNYPRP